MHNFKNLNLILFVSVWTSFVPWLGTLFVFIYCFVRSVIKNLVANEQFRFSCAYAYVERVTSENCTRQISGFVLLVFPLMLMFMSRLFSHVLMLMLVLVLMF